METETGVLQFRYKSYEHSGLAWGAILRKLLGLTSCLSLPCSFVQEHVPKIVWSLNVPRRPARPPAHCPPGPAGPMYSQLLNLLDVRFGLSCASIFELSCTLCLGCPVLLFLNWNRGRLSPPRMSPMRSKFHTNPCQKQDIEGFKHHTLPGSMLLVYLRSPIQL